MVTHADVLLLNVLLTYACSRLSGVLPVADKITFREQPLVHMFVVVSKLCARSSQYLQAVTKQLEESAW